MFVLHIEITTVNEILRPRHLKELAVTKKDCCHAMCLGQKVETEKKREELSVCSLLTLVVFLLSALLSHYKNQGQRTLQRADKGGTLTWRVTAFSALGVLIGVGATVEVWLCDRWVKRVFAHH